MTQFRIEPQPTRVIFGAGSVERLADEVDTLGWTRVAVLCTPGRRAQGEDIARRLGPRLAAVQAEAVMHVPAGPAEQTIATLRELKVDGCVAVGGGSAVGLAKVVARADVAPYLAVPTTYAGSEMTSVWGTTVDGVKTTGRDPRVRPRAVVYDPDLSAGLPMTTTVTSALNAVAHAAEALYARDASPLTDLMAERGVQQFLDALPTLAQDPHDPAARAAALVGAWLCGSCLGATTMGLHHKLCHVLGGTYGLPHAETHTVVLPYVLAAVLPCEPRAADALARAVGHPDPARELWRLAARLGAPRSLAELGLPESALDAVAGTLADGAGAAGPVSARALRALLGAAFDGTEPEVG